MTSYFGGKTGYTGIERVIDILNGRNHPRHKKDTFPNDELIIDLEKFEAWLNSEFFKVAKYYSELKLSIIYKENKKK